jgi:hypothetical protein
LLTFQGARRTQGVANALCSLDENSFWSGRWDRYRETTRAAHQ